MTIRPTKEIEYEMIAPNTTVETQFAAAEREPLNALN